MAQKPTVFIHTNDKQMLGAMIAAYSMKKASKHPNDFDIKLVRLEETPHLNKRQGQSYLRKGRKAVWLNEDLQSFSPLRRMIPQLMGYQGRAVVTDPDVFAIGDIYDLLTLDMKDKAIFCRNVTDGYRGNGNKFYATSVMLLDCSKLKHWKWNDEIDAMFNHAMDYGPWIALKNEDPSTIGELVEEWNSFDYLTPATKLLHNTERSTQPWRTGLPTDFDLTTSQSSPAKYNVRTLLKKFLQTVGLRPRTTSGTAKFILPHPDPAQEVFFYELLKGALESGAVEINYVNSQIASGEIRKDSLEILSLMGYPSQRINELRS